MDIFLLLLLLLIYWSVCVYLSYCYLQESHVMCEHRVLLKTFNHPFLVKLHFSFQTKDRLYLVLDYACGGEVCLHTSIMGLYSSFESV